MRGKQRQRKKLPQVPPKARAQRQHGIFRLATRFGFPPEDYQILCDRIKKGEGDFIRAQSNSTSLWRLYHKGKTLYAFYDRKRSQIKTFITETMFLIWLERQRQHEDECA